MPMSIIDPKWEVSSLLEQSDIITTKSDTSALISCVDKGKDINTAGILVGFNKAQNERLKPYSFKKLVKLFNQQKLDGDIESYLKPRPLTRIPWSNQSLIEKYLEKSIAFIIEDCPIVQHAVDVWTPSYLEKKFGDHKTTVFMSDSNYFRYWSQDKNVSGWVFDPPNKKNHDLTFKEYFSKANMNLEQLQGTEDGNHGHKKKKQNKDIKWMYLQHSLGDFPGLAPDFRQWDWGWILKTSQKYRWGLPDSNLLLMGMKNSKTPVHFDERQNIFCQVRGRKRVCIYPPSDMDYLYSFPYGHPCDRQSMVNIDYPNVEQFPEFRKAHCLTDILGPKDTLFIPAYCWHYFHNIDQFATSITFWSKQKPNEGPPTYPLSCNQLIAARRNLEDIVLKHFKHISNAKKKHMMILKASQDKNSNLRRELEQLTSLLLPQKKKYIESFLHKMFIGRYDRPMQWFTESAMMDTDVLSGSYSPIIHHPKTAEFSF